MNSGVARVGEVVGTAVLCIRGTGASVTSGSRPSTLLSYVAPPIPNKAPPTGAKRGFRPSGHSSE